MICKNGIVIEPYRDELDDVLDIENACFTDPWTKEMFIGAIGGEYTYFTLARDSGKICGYLLALIYPPEAEIMSIAVHPDCMGKGIGAALITEFISQSEARGSEAIYLEVRKSNERALRLYNKFDFVPVGIRKNYYSNPREDAIVMVRQRPQNRGN